MSARGRAENKCKDGILARNRVLFITCFFAHGPESRKWGTYRRSTVRKTGRTFFGISYNDNDTRRTPHHAVSWNGCEASQRWSARVGLSKQYWPKTWRLAIHTLISCRLPGALESKMLSVIAGLFSLILLRLNLLSNFLVIVTPVHAHRPLRMTPSF
jgi:hypothetical protein